MPAARRMTGFAAPDEPAPKPTDTVAAPAAPVVATSVLAARPPLRPGRLGTGPAIEMAPRSTEVAGPAASVAPQKPLEILRPWVRGVDRDRMIASGNWRHATEQEIYDDAHALDFLIEPPPHTMPQPRRRR